MENGIKTCYNKDLVNQQAPECFRDACCLCLWKYKLEIPQSLLRQVLDWGRIFEAGNSSRFLPLVLLECWSD